MRLWGMTIRWPWDHTAAAEHTERVERQELRVDRIHREAMQQRAENGIGELLGDLFRTPPKDTSP